MRSIKDPTSVENRLSSFTSNQQTAFTSLSKSSENSNSSTQVNNMALRFPSTPASKLPKPPPGPHPREVMARAYLESHLLSKHQCKYPPKENELPLKRLPDPPLRSGDDLDLPQSVCIVGAGAAGLGVAMMLKYLGVKNVDIFEATGQVGGRCATKTFGEKEGKGCPHNYYDMGAMRIPDIIPMASTLNLIQNEELLNIGSKLKNYVYRVSSGSGEGEVYYEPTCYWGDNSGKSQPE